MINDCGGVSSIIAVIIIIGSGVRSRLLRPRGDASSGSQSVSAPMTDSFLFPIISSTL